MVYTRLDLDPSVVSPAIYPIEYADRQLIKPYTYVHVRCQFVIVIG